MTRNIEAIEISNLRAVFHDKKVYSFETLSTYVFPLKYFKNKNNTGRNTLEAILALNCWCNNMQIHYLNQSMKLCEEKCILRVGA